MAASTASVSKSGLYADPRPDWLALRQEEILEPTRTIVDPHHHLWDRDGQRYLIEEITSDLACGHNVIATIYVEARSMYRAHGPEAFRPVGEVEFANGAAAMSASGGYGPAAAPASSATSTSCSETARRPCSRRKSPPVKDASAASAIPPPGTATPMSQACMRRGREDCCSIQLSERVSPASHRWA